MRTKVLFAAMVVVVVMLAFASPAMAGQVTRIMYGLQNIDYYTYTPTQTGTLDITVSWTDENGSASVYPVSEVDAVVQCYDDASKEDYYDIDIMSLYDGTNPEVGSLSVVTKMVNKPIYIGVIPWIGDCPYQIVVTFRGATVIDQTGTARGNSGEFFLPATSDNGTWLSVLQYWPGSLNRAGSTSDVYANWDDYAWELDPNGPSTLANEWELDLNSYIAPLRTETAISSTEIKPAPKNQGYPDRWHIVGPEIWTGALRPNVWTKIASDIYPKPATVAYNAAPLWYTYSWTDTAVADAPAYFWGNTATTSAYGHSYSSSVATSAKFAGKFYGPSVTWQYRTSSASGVAKVSIDGAQVDTVDQYSAAPGSGEETYDGLANAAHTILVENNKTKNENSSSSFITHDRFVAPGFSGDTQPFMENNTDGMTTYGWGVINSTSASGGSYASNVSTSAALAFTFSGTSITWKYTKNAAAGVARVYIDGVDKGTVDLYASSPTFQQTSVFGSLPAGLHTILIVNNKTKNENSSSSFITHDAFIVGATTVEN